MKILNLIISSAYLLADEGFDVWMGNARGNRYSRNHTHFDPDGDHENRKKFWDFSWHEIGVHDVPTIIDYILAETGKPKLHYVGHSQGTTVYFVMCAERPEYNQKIILGNMLAPTAFMTHGANLFFHLIHPFVTPLDSITKLIGLYEFLPSNELYGLIGRDACYDTARFQIICENIIFLISGYSSDQLNEVSSDDSLAKHRFK